MDLDRSLVRAGDPTANFNKGDKFLNGESCATGICTRGFQGKWTTDGCDASGGGTDNFEITGGQGVDPESKKQC
jgi:hypothetical protein